MKIIRLLAVASAAFFYVGTALAQNVGTVTNHAFAVGKGAGKQGFTSVLCGAGQLPVGQSGADPICRTVTGDVTIDIAGVLMIGASKVTNAMLVGPVSVAKGGTGQTSISATLDAAFGSTQGNILYRNASAWVVLAPGTSGQLLSSGGPAANVSWTTASGTGTVTNVGTGGLATGGPITASGTVTVTAAVQSDQETGTSTTTAVTPGRQHFHPSASKAWAYVTISGGVATPQQSYNVASTPYVTVGQYRVNFSSSFSASNAYGCTVSVDGSALFANVVNRTAGLIEIQARAAATGALTEAAGYFITCFGDL